MNRLLRREGYTGENELVAQEIFVATLASLVRSASTYLTESGEP